MPYSPRTIRRRRIARTQQLSWRRGYNLRQSAASSRALIQSLVAGFRSPPRRRLYRGVRPRRLF